MAALTRPTTANYQVHESVQVDTQDNEDHTFCGIMFPIKAKKDLPVHQLIINSVAVRGQLGPMTVWVSNRDAAAEAAAGAASASGAAVNGNEGQVPQPQQEQQQQQRQQYEFPLQSRHWTQIFNADVKPSRREYATLDLSSNPIVLYPGEVRAVYIHSASPGDEGVVYDNSSIHPGHWHNRHGGQQMNNRPLRATPRYQDKFLAIHSARAHLSPRPFGQSPIWGWGNAWREHREFVGRINFGVRFMLWNPENHSRYFSITRPSTLSQQQRPPQRQLHQQQGLSSPFGEAVLAILACQRRWESPWSKLPDECIYYILNMCRYDWFGDTPEQLKTHRRQRARRLRQLEAQARQAREEQEAEAATGQGELAPQEAAGASSLSDGQHEHQQHQQVEEMFVDAQEEEQPREVHVIDNVVDDNDDHVGDSDVEDSDVVMSEEEADDEGSLDADDDEEEEDEEESEEEEEEEEVAAGDDDDDDDSDTREWHRAHGYHPPHAVFAYDDISSGEEEENDDQDDEAVGANGRPGWIQRHLARVSLLRAMAGGGGGHR